MGKSLRKIQRQREKSSSALKEFEAWQKGFDAGAKKQNEQDTLLIVEWLGKLEQISGVGPKIARNIRQHYLEFMDMKRSDQK